VVRLAGITPTDLQRYKSPPTFESRDGAVAQPALDPRKPQMEFPPGMEKIYRMTDEEITSRLSETTPPVAHKR
jgi:hypothetical protein